MWLNGPTSYTVIQFHDFAVLRGRFVSLLRQKSTFAGDWFCLGADLGQRAEAGVECAPAVEVVPEGDAKHIDELVEVGFQMVPTQPRIDPKAQCLRLAHRTRIVRANMRWIQGRTTCGS